MRIDLDAEADRRQTPRAVQCIRRLLDIRRQTQHGAGRIEQDEGRGIAQRLGIECDKRLVSSEHLHRIEIGEQIGQATQAGEHSRLAGRLALRAGLATQAVSDQVCAKVDDRLANQQGSG